MNLYFFCLLLLQKSIYLFDCCRNVSGWWLFYENRNTHSELTPLCGWEGVEMLPRPVWSLILKIYHIMHYYVMLLFYQRDLKLLLNNPGFYNLLIIYQWFSKLIFYQWNFCWQNTNKMVVDFLPCCFFTVRSQIIILDDT